MRKFLLLAIALLTTTVGSAQSNWRSQWDDHTLYEMLEVITGRDLAATDATLDAWNNFGWAFTIPSNIQPVWGPMGFDGRPENNSNNLSTLTGWNWELAWDSSAEVFYKYEYIGTVNGTRFRRRIATFDPANYTNNIDLAIAILNFRREGSVISGQSPINAYRQFTQGTAFRVWFNDRYPSIAANPNNLTAYWDAFIMEAHLRGIPIIGDLDQYTNREGFEKLYLTTDLPNDVSGRSALGCAVNGESGVYLRIRFNQNQWYHSSLFLNISTKMDLVFHEIGHGVYNYGHPPRQGEIMSTSQVGLQSEVGDWIDPDVWVSAMDRLFTGTNQIQWPNTTTCSVTIIPEIEDDLTLDFGALESVDVTTLQATEGSSYEVSVSYSGTVEDDYGLDYEWLLDGEIISTTSTASLENLRFEGHSLVLNVSSLNGARPVTFEYQIDVLEAPDVSIDDINITTGEGVGVDLTDGHIDIYKGEWWEINASAKEGVDVVSLQWILEGRPERNNSRVPGQIVWRFCCALKTSPLTLRATLGNGSVIDFDFNIQSHEKPDIGNNLDISVNHGSYDEEQSVLTVQVSETFSLFFNYTGDEETEYSVVLNGDPSLNQSSLDNVLQYSFAEVGNSNNVEATISVTPEGLPTTTYTKNVNINVVDEFNPDDLSFSISGRGTSIIGDEILVQVGEWFYISASHSGNQPEFISWAINGNENWNVSPHDSQLWWRFSSVPGSRTLTYTATRNGIAINKTFTITAYISDDPAFVFHLNHGATEGDTVDGVTTINISSCPPSDGLATIEPLDSDGNHLTGYIRARVDGGAGWQRLNTLYLNFSGYCGLNFDIEYHALIDGEDHVRIVRFEIPN